jgi:tartrate dehydratase beta subunit/fumarate hydratase class I family protein
MQVECALKLITSGTITIEMVQKAKGRVPMLPKQINQATGKAFNQFTGFNEASLGACCSSYVKSAKKLLASQFNEIISLAAEYLKVEDDNVIEITDDDDDNIHANIVDVSSGSKGDIDCM